MSSSKRSSEGEKRQGVGNKENQWWRHVVQEREVGRRANGGGRRFHYNSEQNPLKANLAGKKKSKNTDYSLQAQSEIIH